MGSVSDGAYGEVDYGGGYDSDTLDIMEMNREAEIADAERDRKLDIKGIAPPEEDDDLLDFSNPTRDEATPLGKPGPEFDYREALDKLS